MYNLVKNGVNGGISGICRGKKRGIVGGKTQCCGCCERLLYFSEGFLLLCILGFLARVHKEVP